TDPPHADHTPTSTTPAAPAPRSDDADHDVSISAQIYAHTCEARTPSFAFNPQKMTRTRISGPSSVSKQIDPLQQNSSIRARIVCQNPRSVRIPTRSTYTSSAGRPLTFYSLRF